MTSRISRFDIDNLDNRAKHVVCIVATVQDLTYGVSQAIVVPNCLQFSCGIKILAANQPRKIPASIPK